MVDSVMRNYAISIFSDGSKTEIGTGCGVLVSDDLDISQIAQYMHSFIFS